MRCKFCGKKLQVAYVCPYCKEYYCREHYEPQKHNCPHSSTIEKLKPVKKQKQSKPLGIQKKLSASLFTLVIIDEILRQVSYVKNSPYLEPNIYVLIASQWINPYIASTIIFLTTCITIFATDKLSEIHNNLKPEKNLLKKVISIGIYATTAAIYIPTVIQWLILLST